jgi:hypothetical protein
MRSEYEILSGISEGNKSLFGPGVKGKITFKTNLKTVRFKGIELFKSDNESVQCCASINMGIV